MAKRTVICASPRAMGKSARVSKGLVDLLSGRYPEDEVDVVRLADLDIHHCIGCNTCKEDGECFMEDDMARMLETLARTDVLYVVSPVYFAGPPANYKAMLDRLQPHFYLGTRKAPKSDAHLIVIGDGGDPNGFDPLVVCTRSALAVGGFKLQTVCPYIGVDAADAVALLADDLFDGECV